MKQSLPLRLLLLITLLPGTTLFSTSKTPQDGTLLERMQAVSAAYTKEREETKELREDLAEKREERGKRAQREAELSKLRESIEAEFSKKLEAQRRTMRESLAKQQEASRERVRKLEEAQRLARERAQATRKEDRQRLLEEQKKREEEARELEHKMQKEAIRAREERTRATQLKREQRMAEEKQRQREKAYQQERISRERKRTQRPMQPSFGPPALPEQLEGGFGPTPAPPTQFEEEDFMAPTEQFRPTPVQQRRPAIRRQVTQPTSRRAPSPRIRRTRSLPPGFEAPSQEEMMEAQTSGLGLSSEQEEELGVQQDLVPIPVARPRAQPYGAPPYMPQYGPPTYQEAQPYGTPAYGMPGEQPLTKAEKKRRKKAEKARRAMEKEMGYGAPGMEPEYPGAPPAYDAQPTYPGAPPAYDAPPTYPGAEPGMPPAYPSAAPQPYGAPPAMPGAQPYRAPMQPEIPGAQPYGTQPGAQVGVDQFQQAFSQAARIPDLSQKAQALTAVAPQVKTFQQANVFVQTVVGLIRSKQFTKLKKRMGEEFVHQTAAALLKACTNNPQLGNNPQITALWEQYKPFELLPELREATAGLGRKPSTMQIQQILEALTEMHPKITEAVPPKQAKKYLSAIASLYKKIKSMKTGIVQPGMQDPVKLTRMAWARLVRALLQHGYLAGIGGATLQRMGQAAQQWATGFDLYASLKEATQKQLDLNRRLQLFRYIVQNYKLTTLDKASTKQARILLQQLVSAKKKFIDKARPPATARQLATFKEIITLALGSLRALAQSKTYQQLQTILQEVAAGFSYPVESKKARATRTADQRFTVLYSIVTKLPSTINPKYAKDLYGLLKTSYSKFVTKAKTPLSQNARRYATGVYQQALTKPPLQQLDSKSQLLQAYFAQLKSGIIVEQEIKSLARLQPAAKVQKLTTIIRTPGAVSTKKQARLVASKISKLKTFVTKKTLQMSAFSQIVNMAAQHRVIGQYYGAQLRKLITSVQGAAQKKIQKAQKAHAKVVANLQKLDGQFRTSLSKIAQNEQRALQNLSNKLARASATRKPKLQASFTRDQRKIQATYAKKKQTKQTNYQRQRTKLIAKEQKLRGELQQLRQR